jgi:hypothetical protein
METLFTLSEQMSLIEQTLDENGGELTPELEGQWVETEESLKQKIDNYNSLVKLFDYRSENIAAEIKRLQALKKTTDNSKKRVVEHLKDVMEAFGLTKLEGKLCKVSLSSSTSTEVDEETVLQPYLSRIEMLHLPEWISVDFKVSKTALKEAFKDKDITPAGVSFVKNTSLRFR